MTNCLKFGRKAPVLNRGQLCFLVTYKNGDSFLFIKPDDTPLAYMAKWEVQEGVTCELVGYRPTVRRSCA